MYLTQTYNSKAMIQYMSARPCVSAFIARCPRRLESQAAEARGRIAKLRGGPGPDR